MASSTRRTTLRAFVALAREHHGEVWVDPQSGYGVMPPVPLLVATIEAHGSPTRDRFFPGVARTPPPAAYEDALLVLVGDRFRVEPALTQPSAPAEAGVGEVVDATVVRRDDCFTITAAGPWPSATLLGPDGGRFRLSAPRSARIVAVLGLERPPTAPIVVELRPRTPVDVVVPDIRPVTSARLRIELADSSGTVTVCPLAGRG